MTSASYERSLGTLMAIARTRVVADHKTGATTPPGIHALASIRPETLVVVTCRSSPATALREDFNDPERT